MKPVFYLTYSDQPESQGLVFPNELLKGTYSPGFWAIAINGYERLPNSFGFDAVNNNELQTLELKQVNGSVYLVDTKYFGKFYFRIINPIYRYQKYVGKSQLISPDNKIVQVVSMDIQKLSQTSLGKGFFFVGRVDEQIEESMAGK